MKAILTQYTLDNINQENIKWLLENKQAKEIINYYLSKQNNHFLIQNLKPNFTFTKDYVFDNEFEVPTIYFKHSLFENLTKNISVFSKRTTETTKNDDFFIEIKIFIDNEYRDMKIFIKNSKILNLFIEFLQTASKSSFLKDATIMFFNENFANEIYYTISGGLEKQYLFASVLDKLFFCDNLHLFINNFALIHRNKKDKVEVEMKKIASLTQILKGKK